MAAEKKTTELAREVMKRMLQTPPKPHGKLQAESPEKKSSRTNPARKKSPRK